MPQSLWRLQSFLQDVPLTFMRKLAIRSEPTSRRPTRISIGGDTCLTLNVAILPRCLAVTFLSALYYSWTTHPAVLLENRDFPTDDSCVLMYNTVCMCIRWPLAISLSAGSDLWWWMRHVISPRSLVFYQHGIPLPSGPPFSRTHAHKRTFRSSRMREISWCPLSDSTIFNLTTTGCRTISQPVDFMSAFIGL